MKKVTSSVEGLSVQSGTLSCIAFDGLTGEVGLVEVETNLSRFVGSIDHGVTSTKVGTYGICGGGDIYLLTGDATRIIYSPEELLKLDMNTSMTRVYTSDTIYSEPEFLFGIGGRKFVMVVTDKDGFDIKNIANELLDTLLDSFQFERNEDKNLFFFKDMLGV